MTINLNVNGLEHTLELAADTPLIYVLRGALALHGAKLGCGLEQCGSCVVLVDGAPAYSCTTPVGDVAGRCITTVEGLGDAPDALHPLQSAFLELNAAQCGYCTAGIIMAAKALLDANPRPTRDEIVRALNGHLCRCGAHPRVIAAVQRAAARLGSGGGAGRRGTAASKDVPHGDNGPGR